MARLDRFIAWGSLAAGNIEQDKSDSVSKRKQVDDGLLGMCMKRCKTVALLGKVSNVDDEVFMWKMPRDVV